MPKDGRQYIAALYIITLLFCLVTGIILVCGEKYSDTIQTINENAPKSILIIDPGHGGTDGGAVAPDSSKESEINLAISLKLKALSNLLGIDSIIIRDSEALPYPEEAGTIAEKKRWDQNRRLELINSMENAVLISIHQNFYPDSRPFGPQVLYGGNGHSEALGTYCHDNLNRFLCPENRRVAAPVSEKIYLMKNAACPAILVECGFMSNPSELEKLKSDDHQRKIAMILAYSYLGFKS